MLFRSVDAHYDTRTGHYFTVCFRGFSKDETFTTVNRMRLNEQNEWIEENGNLYDEIMAYLNS